MSNAQAFLQPSMSWIRQAVGGNSMSGVTVGTMIRSMSSGFTPACSRACSAALAPRCEAAWPFSAMRRSRMPVRSTIHSSLGLDHLLEVGVGQALLGKVHADAGDAGSVQRPCGHERSSTDLARSRRSGAPNVQAFRTTTLRYSIEKCGSLRILAGFSPDSGESGFGGEGRPFREIDQPVIRGRRRGIPVVGAARRPRQWATNRTSVRNRARIS